MSLPIFTLTPAKVSRVPIVVSIPHAGTGVPPEVARQLRSEIVRELPDTDWFVPELYAFCKDLGIPMIQANLSRYVVDLNRPMEGPALYSDQRRQTDAMPLTSFDGVPLYPAGQEPDAAERARRASLYYTPYHDTLQRLLLETQKQFNHVLLFDAHSIRRWVPSLAREAFADLIVGDRDGSSADPLLSQTLLRILKASTLHIAYNQPFKGGHITRAFGSPQNKIHALQLEMSQDIYMTDDRSQLDPDRSPKVQALLIKALTELARNMESLA